MLPALRKVTMNDLAAVELAVLITRVGFGLMMAAHGYNHFFRGGRIAGTGRWFDSLGMRPGRLHAIVASTTEIGAGLMFAAGLLTPFAAAGFIGLMTVAIATVHRKNGFFIIKEGWEYTSLIAVVALLIATTGPMKYSLDRAFDIDDDLSGWFGFWLSLLLGLGASAALLAVFYRPPKTAKS
jgi:putative oxidoreductase